MRFAENRFSTNGKAVLPLWLRLVFLLMLLLALFFLARDVKEQRNKKVAKESFKNAPSHGKGVHVSSVSITTGVQPLDFRAYQSGLFRRRKTGQSEDDKTLLKSSTNIAGNSSNLIGDRSSISTNRFALGEQLFSALKSSRVRPVDPKIAELAKSITADCKTDAERARALYDWITRKITYDWNEWENIVNGATGYMMPHDPLSVIERGTTVCVGYAWLYNDFARSVGLSSDFIIGKVRGYRGTADDKMISPFLHAWNSVEIDGSWYLMDATWGAIQPGEKPETYAKRSSYYYGTPAEQMIFDHLPEQPAWQLMTSPITSDDFGKLPNLKPPFFSNGLELGNYFTDTIKVNSGAPVDVMILAPDDVELAASISGTKLGTAKVSVTSEDGALYNVGLNSMPAGEYILRVYSRPKGSTANFECSLDYAVEVK